MNWRSHQLGFSFLMRRQGRWMDLRVAAASAGCQTNFFIDKNIVYLSSTVSEVRAITLRMFSFFTVPLTFDAFFSHFRLLNYHVLQSTFKNKIKIMFKRSFSVNTIYLRQISRKKENATSKNVLIGIIQIPIQLNIFAIQVYFSCIFASLLTLRQRGKLAILWTFDVSIESHQTGNS